jgi:hypothetical protein
MLDTVTDPELRKRLSDIQDQIRGGLSRVDPHRRLQGRPVTHRVISGQTFEIVFSEVPRIDETEVLGVKKLIGQLCFCSVSPATAETLTVSFVVPLK